MKKTEWNEGSSARRKTSGQGKEGKGKGKKALVKAVAEMTARRGQADFASDLHRDAVRCIVNNQVP
ncbi:MAG TPA: hypothetical protein PLO63_14475 [Syntrophales bacterium]|jgi:hypothetical protein|nr:hypothetical protein [Syntrophales bacterium]